MKPKPGATVKSADRAFDILEFVADCAEHPSFSQMMTQLQIPRSSLFHLLNNLVARRYLEKDADTDRYCLGGQVRHLARAISTPPLTTTVSSFLKELTAESNETSGFFVRAGDAVEAIASATSSQDLAYTMRVGERGPLYAVSGGKIVLSRMPSDELREYLGHVKLDQITPNTIVSRRHLREQLSEVQKTGFAYSREEFTPGITGIAVAVEHSGRLFGALNFAVPTVRLTKSRELELRRKLESAANILGRAILSSI